MKEGSKVNQLCKDCARWVEHGENCWFWWRNKKTCSVKEQIADPSKLEQDLNKAKEAE